MRWIVIIALCVPLQASADCITLSFTARSLLMGKTDAARATAVSAGALRTTTVLFGTKLHDGDIIPITAGECRRIETGVDYFITARCTVDKGCQWIWVAVDLINGVEEYARNRHIVTRPELMRRLRAWRAHKVETNELQRWLATADSNDTEGDLFNSLTLAVVERIEDLLRFATEAAACDPSDAAWLRDQGSRIFLERFRRLPKQETRSAYGDWLDAHDDAKDDWNPRQLEKDLERSLEAAHSWDHTIDCFLRTHPEATK